MFTSDQPARIVFLDRQTLSPSTVVRAPGFPHRLVEYDRTAPHQLHERIADADIVISNKVRFDAAALDAAKKLRLIAVAATGTDVIDIRACTDRNIAVSNIRNYAVNTVPEHTFALILALRRSIDAYHQSVRNGRWKQADQFCYFDYPINDLANSTLGVIGDGVLGRAVADIAKAFGMKVLFSDYKGTTGMGPLYTPFDEVLARSDVITLHSPLMASTRNMISEAEFSKMQRKPIVINTARGGLVNEEDLAKALLSGRIGGAGFDVVTTEPIPDDHPFMQLMGLPNFVLTPHVAWASEEAIQGLTDQLIDNVDAFVSGAPRNLVSAA
jgi:glycerate dehydrogenase